MVVKTLLLGHFLEEATSGSFNTALGVNLLVEHLLQVTKIHSLVWGRVTILPPVIKIYVLVRSGPT